MTSRHHRDSFDGRAAQYTAERVAPFNAANRLAPGARATERDLLLDRLRLVPGVRVCDAVAGGGFLSEGIHDRLDGDCHIIAVENSESFAATIDPRFHPVVSSLCALDLDDASVDRVACLAGLHHQEDKLAFFREAHRILRPGGIIAVADGRKDSPPARFLNGPVDRFTEIGHDGMFPADGDLTALLREAGFAAIEENHEEYCWPFPDEATMVSYCRDLFRMHEGSLAEVERAIRDVLGVVPLADGRVGMPWGLLYASATRPERG
ncbi:MAG: class I SAM-dependent methyltransferase [Akkermansiaceae bacterium]|nr:class I SAM-dependent methyltransferase [Akkermansiaceae bacterium]NNM30596.1 class I SAM-dependent methyltransferase [Akkermansiaceae bacterium]